MAEKPELRLLFNRVATAGENLLVSGQLYATLHAYQLGPFAKPEAASPIAAPSPGKAAGPAAVSQTTKFTFKP